LCQDLTAVQRSSDAITNAVFRRDGSATAQMIVEIILTKEDAVFVCATQPTNLRAATDSVFLKTGCVMVLMIAEMVAMKPQTVAPDASLSRRRVAPQISPVLMGIALTHD